MDWSYIRQLKAEEQLQEILDKHTEVFTPGLGMLKDSKVDLHKDLHAHSHSVKARLVPIALKANVEAQLERLQADGIIMQAHEPTEWAAPSVPVTKSNVTDQISSNANSQ